LYAENTISLKNYDSVSLLMIPKLLSCIDGEKNYVMLCYYSPFAR